MRAKTYGIVRGQVRLQMFLASSDEIDARRGTTGRGVRRCKGRLYALTELALEWFSEPDFKNFTETKKVESSGGESEQVRACKSRSWLPMSTYECERKKHTLLVMPTKTADTIGTFRGLARCAAMEIQH